MAPADDLPAIEDRVARKWAAAAAKRMDGFDPQWKLDVGSWVLPDAELPADVPQFPREQWVSYPMKRTLALLLCERVLDSGELSDEQWMWLCAVMQYGGKTRVA
jgi:hypothetical protein